MVGGGGGCSCILLHVVVSASAIVLVVLFHSATGANTALACRQLALCGGST